MHLIESKCINVYKFDGSRCRGLSVLFYDNIRRTQIKTITYKGQEREEGMEKKVGGGVSMLISPYFILRSQ